MAAIFQFFVQSGLYYQEASLYQVSCQWLIPIKNYGGEIISKILTEKMPSDRQAIGLSPGEPNNGPFRELQLVIRRQRYAKNVNGTIAFRHNEKEN